MNFVHHIRAEHRSSLPALDHPDGSTRAQTLTQAEDPLLYDILGAFGDLTGYPILVNTSLNGRGEPILQTYEQALSFFREKIDIDVLLLGQNSYERNPAALQEASKAGHTVRISPGTIMSTSWGRDGQQLIIMLKHHCSLRLKPELSIRLLRVSDRIPVADLLDDLEQATAQERDELIRAFDLGLLELSPAVSE